MPRKRLVKKREILPDSKYGNKMIAKFINHLMVDGKKSVSERIVYEALEMLAEKLKKQPLKKEDQASGEGEGVSGAGPLSLPDLLERALDNVRPVVEVRSRRVGGATYQVPVEIRESRRNTLAMRWLIRSARDRSEKGMVPRLANELLDAIFGKGISVKKREDTHKMARANQAFAHFRWT